MDDSLTRLVSGLGRLRQNPDFLRALLDAVPAAIYHSSYDRRQDQWTIRFVSQGLKSLLGYQPEQLENCLSFTHLVVSNIRHYQLFKTLTPENPNFRLAFEFRTADGASKWVSDNGLILFDDNGRMAGSAGVFVDISEQKAREMAIEEENLRLKTTLHSPVCLGGIVGKSPAMHEVFARILKMAITTTNLVILGESGTGKELAARAIHDLSNRANKPFIAVNCSSISESLFESEFFGSLKGAFTGAAKDRDGYLDAADEGTLFLDEVGEIPLNMQVKLLRVLDGYGYIPVGGARERYSNFRLITATNRSFDLLLRQGLMREDFYYRLNALSLHLPPLKERREDIPLLANHFLQKENAGPVTLPPEFMNRLLNYSWPGNIRELQNVISRYLAYRETEFQDARAAGPYQALPGENGPIGQSRLKATEYAPPAQLANFANFADFEKNRLLTALNQNAWRIGRAASSLGFSRSTMYRKMKRHGLSKSPL